MYGDDWKCGAIETSAMFSGSVIGRCVSSTGYPVVLATGAVVTTAVAVSPLGASGFSSRPSMSPGGASSIGATAEPSPDPDPDPDPAAGAAGVAGVVAGAGVFAGAAAGAF